MTGGSQVVLQMDLSTAVDADRSYLAALSVAQRSGLPLASAAPFAAAVAELADNTVAHAREGRLELTVSQTPSPMLRAVVEDAGGGLGSAALSRIEGRRGADEGGLAFARRALDSLEVETTARGTRIRCGMRITDAPALAHGSPPDHDDVALGEEALAELRRHGRALTEMGFELGAARREMERATDEIEETNKGVLALYAELDDRAEMLRAASELKSQFISSVSHDFRTPLSAILTLTELLLDDPEAGGLGSEQRRQVQLIQQSGESLLHLVNDLLDLARIESGRIEIRAQSFETKELLSSLRGVMRATMDDTSPRLVIETVSDVPTLRTDEDKLSQILRNLVSNALDFTPPEGEVRVSARAVGDQVAIRVADTGIGIPPEEQPRVFEEFVQVDSPLQRKRTGTGLGLPITRKLVEALGGELTLESQVGKGSIFTVRIPREYTGESLVSVESVPRGHR